MYIGVLFMLLSIIMNPHVASAFKNKINRGFLVCILTTAILFFPTIFLHRVPLPTDIAHSYLLDTEHRGQNGLIRDTVVQLFPYSDFIFKSYKNGVVPSWYPFIFNGIDLASTGQAPVYSPLNLFIPLFSSSLAFFSFKIITASFCAGFFMFLFLFARKMPWWIACLGGIMWQLSGPMIAWTEWGTITVVLAFFPLLLCAIEQFFETHAVKWLAAATLAHIFMLTAGHLQFYLYGMVVAFFFALTLCIRQRKFFYQPWLLGMITALALNAFIVATVLSPFLSHIAESHRVALTKPLAGTWHSLVYSNIIHTRLPKNSLQFVMPAFWGDQNSYRGGTLNYTESLGYVGVLPLLIILAALFARRVRVFKEHLFWVGVFILACIYNYVALLFLPLNKLAPFLAAFPTFRIVFVQSFCLILFSMQLLAALSAKKETVPFKWFGVSGAVLLGVPILIILKNLIAHIEWNVFWSAQVFHAIGAIVGCAALLYGLSRFPKAHIRIAAALIVFVFIDQAAVHATYNPQQSADPLQNPPAYVEYLMQGKKNPLIYSELHAMDMYALYGIRSIFGYDTNYPETYFQLIKQHGTITSHKNILNAAIFDYGFLKSQGVDFVVVKHDIPALRQVFKRDDVRIYAL